jgi:TonB family protein
VVVSTGERYDTRRRLALAVAASVLLHLSLLIWWRTGSGGGGTPGGGSGGTGATPGGASGSVIEVDIAVDADVPAGTLVPVDANLAAEVPPEDMTPERAALEADTRRHANAHPMNDSLSTASESASGTGNEGTGTGEGRFGEGSGSGGGAGAGDGLSEGAGARVGGSGTGAGGGAVPPRPVEITWPDTRRLAHCVGLRIDVRIRVDAQGRVERVEPVAAGAAPECVSAALATAKQIKFTPGTVAGKPTTMWTQVTIDFEKEK